MKYTTLILLFTALVFGCTSEKQQEKSVSFDSFIFSFDGHSIKFTQWDTIFMRRRDSLPRELLYTIISNETKATVNHFVNSINSTKYDTTYIEQQLQDGSEYKFYVTKGKATKSIYIYGDKGPRSLHNFATWLERLEYKQKFRPINAKINFGNLYHVILPPAPLPPNH